MGIGHGKRGPAQKQRAQVANTEKGLDQNRAESRSLPGSAVYAAVWRESGIVKRKPEWVVPAGKYVRQIPRLGLDR